MRIGAKDLRRWFETIRWLKRSQTLGRVWFRISSPKPDLSAPPPLRAPSQTFTGCSRRPSALGSDRFVVHGHEVQVPCDESWDTAHPSKLVVYHLHYFDDLVADDARGRRHLHRKLLRSWLAAHPPAEGIGWEPYPVSLRLVNWLKCCLAPQGLGDAELAQRVHESAAIHARWLAKRLERHLMGNHLWANAKALIFAGTFFSADEGSRWLKVGLELLRSQLREQILDDGGQFERSPMYQAIMTEDALDLLRLARCYPNVIPLEDVRSVQSKAAAMLVWLSNMTHPDGEISQFNDSALAIAPLLESLKTYALELGIPIPDLASDGSALLAESGYARLCAGVATCIADVGPIGPDYIPGHGHADTLSFELCLGTQRLFVNGGTSTYDRCSLRDEERGTAAHNTIIIDNENSSEVWASFRVARRALPFDVRMQNADAGVSLIGAHDGYLRLPGKVIHRRTFQLLDGSLTLEDTLEGHPRSAWAHFRIHPSWAVEQRGPELELKSADYVVQVAWKNAAGRVRVVPSFWARSFNDRRSCFLAMVPLRNSLITNITWRAAT